MSPSPESILILAPSANDSSVATSVLREAGFVAESVETLRALCVRIEEPIGAIILADEALVSDEVASLQNILSTQASWSDLPIILMASQSVVSAMDFFSASGNISLLERPFSRTALIRAVDVALRARRKQYQVRDLMAQQIRATEMRDEFFATLSHELRTPLSVILGWVEILRTNRLDSPTGLNAIETIERNARVQKSLIDDLLDMSRVITGKMSFDFTTLNLAKLLRSIVNGFQPEAIARGITLNANQPSDGDHLTISGDEPRLIQAISNLISNSIKFTPRGGRIDVSLQTTGERCLITVEDNGAGIDPSFLPSIFDRLKQEDMSSTRQHGGLGLGLAIAAYVIESHFGKITAHSEGRNKGAKMTVVLPRSNVQPLATAPVDSIEPVRSLRGVKILAVDDCPDILDLLELFLGAVEAEVHLADSAVKALHELDHFHPDVILSDIGMPRVDGYQLIKQIRSRSPEQGGQTPAIALTAYARDEERMRALRSGFQMHVSKPISNTELISAIAMLARSKVGHFSRANRGV